MYLDKLVIGTVQFGLDYGINNIKGKVSDESLQSILEFAYHNNIRTLDTSMAYGDSESRIGNFLKHANKGFKVITKVSKKNILDIENSIKKSLNKINVKELDAVLYHDFKSFSENVKSLEFLLRLKNEGVLNKIGYSLYYPNELEFILENDFIIDIIQVPYNIFDRRFENYFKLLNKKNIEIHTRSTFLQGLFFMKKIPSYFIKITDKIIKVQEIAKQENTSVESVCLNYCLINDNIDKVLIGVTSMEELKSNIESVKEIEKIKRIKNEIDLLEVTDENMILPSNWRI